MLSSVRTMTGALFLVAVMLWLPAALHAGRFGLVTTLTGTACTPRSTKSCGEHTLVAQTSTPLEDSEGYGPNVCRIVKTYEVGTPVYVTARTCYRSFCRTHCTATSSCTGPMKNVTTTGIGCCEGFAVDPADEAANKRHRRSYRRRTTLREKGCNLMLRDSVTECLLMLGLNSFTLQMITEARDTADQLGNGNSGNSFTVFAFNDSAANAAPDFSTSGHIVNASIEGKRLLDGSIFQTLVENVSIHVRKGQNTKTYFVNGVEIVQLDACQARNGIVHILRSAIPQSNLTIADRLRQDPAARFTSFLRLLDGANITQLLDVSKRKSRTLLAPTNAAFGNFSVDIVECLLRPENKNYLSQLVLIHISYLAEYNSTLSQRSRLYTFNTRYYLFVNVEDGQVLLTRDRIPLEESDIPANNGVIHALPEVIVPPEVDFNKLGCAATVAATEAPDVMGAGF